MVGVALADYTANHQVTQQRRFAQDGSQDRVTANSYRGNDMTSFATPWQIICTSRMP